MADALRRWFRKVLSRLSPRRMRGGASAPGGESFDYYISTTGSDSNDGSLGSPWAITALMSKTAEISGKRVGALSGAYTVPQNYTDNWGGSTKYHGLRITAAGTALAPTIIQSVVPRGATLVPGTGVDFSLLTLDAEYIQILDFVFEPETFTPIRFWGDHCVVEGNEFGQIQNNSNDNLGSIYFKAAGETKVQSPVIRNNLFRGVYNLAGGNRTVNANHIMGFSVANALVEYNTFEDSYAPLRPKYDWSGYTVRFNLIKGCNNDIVHACTDQASVSTECYVYGNLSLEAYMGDYIHEANQRAANLAYFNNTRVITNPAAGSSMRWWRGTSESPNSGSNSRYYNNIVAYIGTVDAENVVHTFGGESGGTAAARFALMDFNGYPSTFRVRQGDYYAADTSDSTLAAWIARSGFEVHSAQGDPLFTSGTGSDPTAYQLQSGSPFKSTGSTDGTTGGSSCEMGCWGGASPPSRIGADFS